MKKILKTLALGAIISGLASCGSSPVVGGPGVGVMPGGPDVIDAK